MISNKINNISDTIPHILKLGFKFKSVLELSERTVTKYVMSSKEEYIGINTINNHDHTERITLYFMYNDKEAIYYHGFENVINALNTKFRHIYRKEIINKLLDNK